MASIVVAGDTSGSITLAAPAIAGSNTLTLPTQTATLATLTTPSFASTIGVGGATAAASGAGITFPATQSSSTNANTLDDYEEGTWTPRISTANNNFSGTYAIQAGTYTKIGRYVFATFYIQLTGISAQGTGFLYVAGFPFIIDTEPLLFTPTDTGPLTPYYSASQSQLFGRGDGFNLHFRTAGTGGTTNLNSGSVTTGYLLGSVAYFTT